MFLALGIAFNLSSQVNFTANDYVRPYDRPFRFGANLDNYPPWTNQQVANISFGNPLEGAGDGVGLNSFRGSLKEEFLETWGYNIRLADYQHFSSLGSNDNLTFTGYPSAAHRDTAHYCPAEQSALFANIYLPIWDGGANGTPVNDQNYYALYLWKMVSLYKNHVKTWEIWNEPDFPVDAVVAHAPPGVPGNWWENNPAPCDYALKAPIFHYNRLLRISWEVIKTADSTAYVCIGGIGNAAFLDAVLRNTDNPADGSVSADYPLKGGAYFDVLSFHSYPHLDGSMWEFPPSGGLFFYRHSDRGIEGMLNLRDNLRNVLQTHGYNGATFPEKHWMISETNIPRSPFNVYIGSDEAQVNYIVKALAEAKKQRFLQLYLYILSDLEPEADAWNEFQTMGLFKNLSEFTYPDFELNPAANAWKTTANFLAERDYHELLSTSLNLPGSLSGGAFTNATDTLFILWAKTSVDSSEAASATYAFPAAFGFDTLFQMYWDHSLTSDTTLVLAGSVTLTGTPIFLQKKPPFLMEPEDTMEVAVKEPLPMSGLEIFPNPAGDQFRGEFNLAAAETVTLRLFDSLGRLREVVFEEQALQAGRHSFLVKNELEAGVYWVEVTSKRGWKEGRRLVRR